jgi:hypothetical protein
LNVTFNIFRGPDLELEVITKIKVIPIHPIPREAWAAAKMKDVLR